MAWPTRIFGLFCLLTAGVAWNAACSSGPEAPKSLDGGQTGDAVEPSAAGSSAGAGGAVLPAGAGGVPAARAGEGGVGGSGSGGAGTSGSGGAGAPAQPDAAAQDASQGSATGGDAGSGESACMICPSGASYGEPLPADRTARLLKNGFGFVEGPLWVNDTLVFSDMDFASGGGAQGPSSQIRRFTPPDTFDVFVASSGSNGLALALDGRILAATHDSQDLSYFDPISGQREARLLRFENQHFNCPNDLAVRSDGNVYFSDPDYQLGSRSSETGMKGLYRGATDGTVSLIDGTLNQPNGVALSPDDSSLYVASAGSELWKYPLSQDGTPGERSSFATPGATDGLTIDCAGNVYAASNTVQVFSPQGQKLGDIQVGEQPSNVAFGGDERKTLYITARSGLYSIELNVPGRCY